MPETMTDGSELDEATVTKEWEIACEHATPLVKTVLAWTIEGLHKRGYSLPACKQAARVIAALLITDTVARNDLVSAIQRLGATAAKDESVDRQLRRILGDPRLDAQRLLPDLFKERIPEILAAAVNAHRANQNCGAAHPPGFCRFE